MVAGHSQDVMNAVSLGFDDQQERHALRWTFCVSETAPSDVRSVFGADAELEFERVLPCAANPGDLRWYKHEEEAADRVAVVVTVDCGFAVRALRFRIKLALAAEGHVALVAVVAAEVVVGSFSSQKQHWSGQIRREKPEIVANPRQVGVA